MMLSGTAFFLNATMGDLNLAMDSLGATNNIIGVCLNKAIP